jgi:hypothetical protein
MFLWYYCINATVLDIIHRPVFCLKRRFGNWILYSSVEPTRLNRIARALLCGPETEVFRFLISLYPTRMCLSHLPTPRTCSFVLSFHLNFPCSWPSPWTSFPFASTPTLSRPCSAPTKVFLTIVKRRVGLKFLLRSRGPGFYSRRYQIVREIVGLERRPLSLVSTIEELLGRNNSGFGLEKRQYGRGDPLRWPRDTWSSWHQLRR